MCDQGDANTDQPQYGTGCTLICSLGPRCGDGIVQEESGEQCEPDRDISVPCTPECRFKSRLIFITSEVYDGSLGGVAGAYDKCNTLAEGAGLPGEYRPWLLAADDKLSDRFPEYSQQPLKFVYFTTLKNIALAESFQELLDTGPRKPISVTEKGDLVYKVRVWTNVTSDGHPGVGDCLNWKSLDEKFYAGVGINGYSEVDKQLEWRTNRWWTEFGQPIICKANWIHLYCIQVTD